MLFFSLSGSFTFTFVEVIKRPVYHFCIVLLFARFFSTTLFGLCINCVRRDIHHSNELRYLWWLAVKKMFTLIFFEIPNLNGRVWALWEQPFFFWLVMSFLFSFRWMQMMRNILHLFTNSLRIYTRTSIIYYMYDGVYTIHLQWMDSSFGKMNFTKKLISMRLEWLPAIIHKSLHINCVNLAHWVKSV